MKTVLDIAFRGEHALIATTEGVTQISRNGETRHISITGIPDVVIRDIESMKPSRAEMLLLGFGGACYKPKVARDGSLLLVEAGKVPASARLPLRLKVYNASVAIAPLQPVFTHVLRIPSSDKPDGPNVFCLLFDRFAKKPTGAYLLFLEEGLKDPLRADLSVRIRTECPPIDVQDGIIAAVIGSSIWIGWAKNGALLRLNVPTMEHEVPEAIALDWRGETLICALRSRHGKGIRVLRTDLRPWLSGTPPRDPREIEFGEAVMEPCLPENVPAPDFKSDVMPLRIAPSGDWMVAQASGLQGEGFYDYFFVVNLNWDRS